MYIVGGEVILGVVGQRTYTFANVTIQDGGVLDLTSNYGNIDDIFTLQVSLLWLLKIHFLS